MDVQETAVSSRPPNLWNPSIIIEALEMAEDNIEFQEPLFESFDQSVPD